MVSLCHKAKGGSTVGSLPLKIRKIGSEEGRKSGQRIRTFLFFSALPLFFSS
jgi:hypothetical protein